jgi:uncharacterized protein
MPRHVAEQGLPDAQSDLGTMYAMGKGVLQDHVTAHIWFNLAAVSGDKHAVANRDNVAALMTPAQIAEAGPRVEAEITI